MVFASIPCPRCGLAGQLEFHYCQRSKKVYLLCDECQSIWLNPQRMDEEEIDPPWYDIDTFGRTDSPSEVFITEVGCSYKESREATVAEIIQYGWGEYIRK